MDCSDDKHRLKNEILADKISRLLFGDTTDLLDEIFAHSLSIDYFNVYLSLPIFGQRVLYQQTTGQFDFDPPLLSSSVNQNIEQIKAWLIRYRLNDYIETDIYIESLLGLLLARNDDNISESSAKSHAFLGIQETKIDQPGNVFSTMKDVRRFHQFLQSNLGMKYWDFFIDSIRLLRSRHSTHTTRIDISSLNFIYKYYSRQAQFRSIVLDSNKSSMPHSSTPDSECFLMAINAMEQLRVYWLPRFFSEIHSLYPDKTNHRTDTVQATDLTKYKIDNSTYLDYNLQECLLIQSSESTPKVKSKQISFMYSEDDAKNDHVELFYRIFVSDFLAGSPFCQYIIHKNTKSEGRLYQTCLRFIIDAEILFSIPLGRFQERILRQFILKYLHAIATEEFPSQIQLLIEQQRTDLIAELTINDHKSYPQLSTLLLDITRFLIPSFLDYVQYDRLRFLLQGKASNPLSIIDELHQIFPWKNLEPSLIERLKNKISGYENGDSNEKAFNPQLILTLCGGDHDNLIKTSWMTTEKLLNTDEQCPFPTGEHLPPLTDIELETELNQYCPTLQRNDIQNILGKAFHVSITSHSSDQTTFIGHPALPSKLHSTSISDQEYSPLNAVELFTLDILQSARDILQIDQFVSSIMDDGWNLFQTNPSLDSTPLSPVFDEILLTDLSSIVTSKSIFNTTNNNAVDLHQHSEEDDQPRFSQPKILSFIASYFINAPNSTSSNNQLHIQSSKLEHHPSVPKFLREIIRFARKDASNEVKNLPFNQGIFQGHNAEEQQLLQLIHQEILSHLCPLEDYLASNESLAWHAFEQARRISNLDDGLMLNDDQFRLD